MRPRILSMSCLLMAATLMMAQGIKRHEYWIDADYGSAQSEMTDNTSISVSIPIAGLSSGIHFLNYRALNTDDEWGTLSRTLFYVPEEAVGDATVKSCEYWLDSDYANRKPGQAGNSISPSIDVSKLSSGIHFFNYLAVNNYDEKGTLSRTLFYIPEEAVGDATVQSCEYWIDSDYANHQVGEAGNSISPTIDVSTLSSGIHFFNYLAVNNFGEAGTLSRTLFYIPEETTGDASVKSYEYWIDNDYAGKKSGESDNSITASIDISKLSSGIHFFNYRAVNSFDEAGTLSRTLFYIPEQALEDPVITAYEYWLDDDMSTKVSGTEAQDVYVLAMNIAKLKDGDHTFSFRAQNSNGDWNTLYTESFALDGNAYIKENGVTYVIPEEEQQTLMVNEAEEGKTEVEIPVTITVGETEYTVTVIAEKAFEDNTALVKITIPETVISIEAGAFAGCTALTDIFSYAKEPIALGATSKVSTRAGGAEVDVSSVFDQVNKNKCTLHVPFGSKAKYKEADGWKDFKNIVEMVSDIPGDANSDWEVNDLDVKAIVHYIMTGETDGIIFGNANVNGDDKLDAADIVVIVNMINNPQ